MRLVTRGVKMIGWHRRDPPEPRTQNGRKLRRYNRRRKADRLLASTGNFRPLPVRHERHLANCLGFVRLAYIIILLGCCL